MSDSSEQESPTSAPKTASATSQLIGETLGEFRLLRRLGAGGMAEVYLAEQTSLKRQVALKVLRSDAVDESDTTLLRRFEQEATSAANLNHPNIVQVYAVGEDGGHHYIAQEYVPGLTLRDYVKKKGPPDVATSLRILRQVAAALEAARTANIVHRDIKPENILLTKKGEAKVADFGLAQLSLSEDRLALTQVGMTMGTPLYMSPEQVNGQVLDHRSDIYSLGVTAYHLFTGQPPFRGQTALSIAVKHLNESPTPIREVRPDLPAPVCDLVERMMEKRPERRYQAAKDLVQDIRELLSRLKNDPSGLDNVRLSKLSAVPKPPAKWPLSIDQFYTWNVKRHFTLLLLVVLILGGAGAGIGWATRPGDPFRTPPAPPRMRKMDSALQQYWTAANNPTNMNAWMAVIEYFPEDRLWVHQAQFRLALLFLADNDLASSAKYFRELAAISTDSELRATGNAGLAIIAEREGNYSEYQQQMSYALAGGDAIRSELVPYLRIASQRNREQLNAQQQRVLERLLDEAELGEG
ncbi:serine/threonine-protein kinase [Calycomorphotria hydatis]|uniref:non-specific serine/threonine protein kinase n=1 Tax=Calycomorphotria hydatis TaxID=2528027 RepID=A0A517T3Y2_9PLAN|nr:serine/threonine-protein kinase [Calycomorphotria hydatis]QDT63082.1 Serine/threonine-protein kinase PrkC [Calycomorphotria hydatis]